MRRALRVFQQAGAAQNAMQIMQQGECSAMAPAMLRQMSSASPESPLSKIMPPIVAIPRQAVGTAFSLTGKLLVGAATSGAVKSVVSSFADKVVIEEAIVKIQDLDPSYWAYWLAAAGYTSQAGFKKLADAAKAKVYSFNEDQITNLVTGLHSVHYYDKDLFEGVAHNISHNFTKYDTTQLLKILKAYSDFGHFNAQLFDDIADSITYCNHYLAPIKAPTDEVVAGIAAYAKFGHERADLLVTLARGISEVGLSKLDATTRRNTVVSGLQSLSTLGFYPEQVDALLYYTKTQASEYSADELKVADNVTAAVEAQAGGSLELYTPSDEDATHWYGHHNPVPDHYELYVFRQSLVPESYSPASVKAKK